MDYAISMYQGGERVYAKDCDFNSYSEIGLLCPVCKQEVYLRKGDIRKSYFAHLHATNSRQVKQCSLRVSSDETATETINFIEDRGQRLKIFQQQFLSMFSIGKSKIVDDVNFNNWINSIKVENNQVIKINNIIEDCIIFLIKHRQLMENKYIIHPNIIKNKQIILQQQIALQAMSYLSENAKFNFNLRYLLFYSIYQSYKHEKYKLFQQQFTTKDIDKICQYTVKVIMLNPWISAFKTIKFNNLSNETKPNIIRINKSKISTTSIQLPIPFLCYGGKKLDQPIRYTLEVTSRRAFELTVFYHSSRNRQDEVINKKTEVMKICAGIGYLKPSFEVIPLEDKLVFSSLVDEENVNFNFHYEVIKSLALPHWIENAAQYVNLNEIAPVWLVISKLWLKATDGNATDNSTIDDIIKPQSFTELQWRKALIESANLLPNCVALQNPLKAIPENYQYLLTPIDVDVNEK
ncbi:hypothetical protein Cylst_4837 [Cylindrospermum stagnale PCC 7417]|uniref:Competence protein CoiA-like N-terminal domain-containing protein n=1 Tax=Cylindrospermum stagnale PCC 7417 TaxID=56107 RepID=K9X343_9NOST|nr:hypothetical protein [Cylindrospermum stagnale]AFZ26893.1 hypothetical protein Cylst_4837 [Cylindrospermum stagnale PCC 7417]